MGSPLEEKTPTAYTCANSFTAVVGQKYLIFAMATMHLADISPSVSGATVLLQSNVAGAGKTTDGTHGSGVMIVCTATSTTVKVSGGSSDGALDGLIVTTVD